MEEHLQQTTRLNVVGTYYYQANAAYTNGELIKNSPIKLVADLENEFDKNAVAVFSKNYLKLGHIKKEYAPKYQKLVIKNNILSCSVFDAFKSSNSINLQISITYTDEELKAPKKKTFNAPVGSGVYRIKLGTNRHYIGSTKDFKTRLNSHLNELRSGTHKNAKMQNDFNSFGETKLSFEVILFCSKGQLEVLEEEAIKSALQKNEKLYNMTSDGRGYISNTATSNESISDRKNNRQTSQARKSRVTHDVAQNDEYLTEEKINLFKSKIKIYLHETSKVRAKEHASIEKALRKSWLNRFGNANERNPGYEGRRFVFGKYGFGREFYQSGDCYAGSFKKNQRHGHGTIRFTSGDVYAGSWVQGERTGLGSYTWKDGTVFTGEWWNGKMHGCGHLQSNKNNFWGIWRHGDLEKKFSS